ncbi:CHAT domain-containing protein [Nostoc sp. CCY0012]|uniref:CHAT domain-containing protein n=1 Tax=Nostoc sp. CCY0012 TaxID=1056123 RepID=UPI0039C6211B
MNSNDQIKILFLTSDPSDAARLRLGQELRDIRERLQLAKKRDRFVLESRESVRPGDITQAIFDIEPQIVHFSGHGKSTGELCFEDLLGKYQLVQPDALAALFELVADQINCVVLNACYSEAQAQAIAAHIPFVIGMNQAIGDQAAIAFAVGFYKALAANRTIDSAYKFGCVEIRLQGIPEHLIPVLYIKPSSVSSQAVQPIASSSLTPGQKRRILAEIDSLQQQLDLLSEKLALLRHNSAIESGTAVKFQLLKQIEQAETERTQITQRIEQLENSL